MNDYWDSRFQAEGRIWGEVPSRTAEYALGLFRRNKVRKILVPGSGYGRNTKVFSTSGFDVTGIEISAVAHELAQTFDPLSRFYNASVLDMSFDKDSYDAIYCFNVLHLLREEERNLFVQQCIDKVKNNGVMFFTVFSEQEDSYGRGKEVEKNTFESRPGRPAHYFDEDDLREQFKSTELLETGIIDEPEEHGGQPHIHILRYIYMRVLSHA
jgi:SAM-dependent methyltransferase